MKLCHQCETLLPDDARYCLSCGAPQFASLGESREPGLDFEAPLEPQLRTQFFQALRRQVAEEQPGAGIDSYLRRLGESGFRLVIDRRIAQLVEEIGRLQTQKGPDLAGATRLMQRHFQELLDFFLIHHCRDINPLPLPELILKYQQADPGSTDLYRMILDFLDLSREEEDIFLYSQFLAVPAEKLRTAGRSFLFPEKEERIFLIGDQSLFGSCREGLAFTDRAIYWRAHLQKPHKVLYSDIREVKREREWLLINGQFFHVNPTFDIKTLKLLKKLGEWFA